MEHPSNPFPLSGYHGPEYFCNRNAEVKRLSENALNGINTTLLSIRRMGKTGLLHHLFHKLDNRRNTQCLYADLYPTMNQGEMLNRLATSIMQSFHKKKNLATTVLDFFKSLRPVVSYEPLTGKPEVSFTFSNEKQQEQSLGSLLRFLDSLNMNIVIALDEFQQITEYPESNTEALLRSLIQPLKNVRFIFSGSSKHLLTEIFMNKKRPFFGSTQLMELSEITKDDYTAYMQHHFYRQKRKISNDALAFICDWTRLHTFYTQMVANRAFSTAKKSIDLVDIQTVCTTILKEQETVFFQYRTLLTTAQWQLLTAIAKEEKLYKPSAKDFIGKYHLGTPSNVQRSLEALLTKEMIYREETSQGSYYTVYDVFLSRWLYDF